MRRKPAMSITKTVRNSFWGKMVVDRENDNLATQSITPELSNKGTNSQIPAQPVPNWASGAVTSLQGQKQAFFLPPDLGRCLTHRISKTVQSSLQNQKTQFQCAGVPG